jgi:hypothetical protein
MFDHKKIKISFLLLILIFLTSNSYAALSTTGLILSVQPFVGYEKTVKYYPTIHYKDRLLYGARILAGLNALAGEAEVSTAEDSEYFYDVPLLEDPTVKIKDKTEKIKLGLRRTYSLLGMISAHIRGGGQASRNTHSFTNKGVTTTTKEPIKYAPYLGAGLKISAFGKFGLVADGTVIINDIHDWRRTEYQATAGISLDL